MRASPPRSDHDALAALARYRILDTPPEAVFDALARLAGTLCGTPIALVSLLDDRRQWFKANVGLDGVTETPRKISFCRFAVLGTEIFEVTDAAADERFATNPLVTGEPYIRFYAGAPLIDADGIALGTLCVLDRVPRRLDDAARQALISIAATVVEQIMARREALTVSGQARERIALLTAAVESASDAIVIAAPAERRDDEPRIVYVNDAYLRQTGARLEDAVGRPLDVTFGPNTDRARVRAMQGRLLEGLSARAEYASYRKDGTEYWIDVSARPLLDEDGRVAHLVYVMRDTTDTVFRELTLATQNERLTRLTSIARGLFGALEPRALIEALRHGLYELTGARALLFAALPDGGFAATTDLRIPARDAVRGDTTVMQAAQSDIPMIADDGRRAAVRVIGSSGLASYILDLQSSTDAPLAAADVFTLQLISQYFAVAARNVELYSELAARRASVTELNQIKNDLIAMLAHDFKGPLTTIVGFADVLAENEALDEEARDYCTMISSSAMRLAGLASDTLALSRLEQNELALTIGDVDIAALVRDVARTFSVTRAIDVRADRDGAVVVRADASRLRQVFENLIGNAIKYSPGGESVDITIRKMYDGVEVAVRDRGIGIPAADREKLFGRFARASNARRLGISGTGFGLYLSRTIVELHGGRIAVESREGAGSTFRVVIPTSSAGPKAATPRILLLDRDGEARSYIAHTLRAAGYAVRVTIAQSDTIEALRNEIFDVAIVDVDRLDLGIPEFSSRLTTAVRGATGFVWLGALAPELEPDAVFLRKPFLIRDLQVAVDAALGRDEAPIEASRSLGA